MIFKLIKKASSDIGEVSLRGLKELLKVADIKSEISVIKDHLKLLSKENEELKLQINNRNRIKSVILPTIQSNIESDDDIENGFIYINQEGIIRFKTGNKFKNYGR